MGIDIMQVHTALLAISALICSFGAHAQSAQSIWSFNGFGTLGATYSDESRADFTPDALSAEGPGNSGALDFGTDSLAGFQLMVEPSSGLSAVMQVVAQRDFDGDVKLKVEWANLQYEFSPALKIRVGRTALGNFMVSDHRKVGNALHWIRPPAELYYIVGITDSDGIDLSYQTHFGNAISTTELSYGRKNLDTAIGHLEVPNLWVISNRLEIKNLTLRASYSSLKIVSDGLDPFFDAYRAFGPQGVTVARNYNINGEWSNFASIGMNYDPGTWFLMTELGLGRGSNEFGDRRGWYASGGYYFGKFTPYATYARSSGGHSSAKGLDGSAFPFYLQTTINALNDSLNILQTSQSKQQHTVSLGLRWNMLPNVSLKGQYDRVSVREDSFGTFSNFELGFRPSGVNVFSVSLDYVF